MFDAAGISTATSAQPLPQDLRSSMSKGYVHSGSAEVPFEINSPAPAGAISATASDMSALFLRLFFALSAIDVSRSTGDAVTISALTDTSGAPVDPVEVEPWVWQEVDGQRRVAVDQQDGVVQAIGLNPAFTLQPMPAERQALPIIAALSLGVLLITALSLPIGAALRRWYGRPRASATPERRLILLRAASLLALIAAGALWSVAAAALLSDSPPPSDLVFRSAQILTAVATLGVVPAFLLLVYRMRHHRRDGRARQVVTVITAGIVALAFSGLAYVAAVGGLLAPSITY